LLIDLKTVKKGKRQLRISFSGCCKSREVRKEDKLYSVMNRVYRARPSPMYGFPPGYLIRSETKTCMFCHKVFASTLRLCGHLGSCKEGKSQRILNNNAPINIVDNDYLDLWLDRNGIDVDDGFDVPEQQAPGRRGCDKYLLLQRDCLSKDTVEFKTGHCLARNGKFVKGIWQHYLAICKTFESCTLLSSGESDSILTLIKFLVEQVGAIIGLPSVYRQVLQTVMGSTIHRKLTTFRRWVKPPSFLFGERTTEVRDSPFVYHDILEVISQQLLDNKVVGEKGENFAVDFECKEVHGKRVISDFHTGEYMRKGSEWVKNNIGPEVKLLPIILSTDKTVVSEGNNKTAFPCYLSVGNLKLKTMCMDGSTELVGYLPEIVDSVALLHAVLRSDGCNSKTLRKEAISVFRRHLEQEVRYCLLC
jgi:hypothetical protein